MPWIPSTTIASSSGTSVETYKHNMELETFKKINYGIYALAIVSYIATSMLVAPRVGLIVGLGLITFNLILVLARSILRN